MPEGRIAYQSQFSKDLATGQTTPLDLPVSNVLKFVFDEDSWYAIRPSGTEPKIKVYYSVKGQSAADAKVKLEELKAAVNERLPEL